MGEEVKHFPELRDVIYGGTPKSNCYTFLLSYVVLVLNTNSATPKILLASKVIKTDPKNSNSI